MISHAAGSRGGPFFGQVFKRAQARLVIGLLRLVEIAEIAEQRRDRLRTRRGQRRVDPGDVVHFAPSPGLKVRIGRISKEPFSSRPSARAVSIASSSEAQSTT